jgi:phosphoglycolate phosphatase
MLIIFDLDGTIYRTESSILPALAELADELEFPQINKELVLRNIGKSSMDFLHDIIPDHINLEFARDRFRILERLAVKHFGVIFTGILDLLDYLAAEGHTLCICSNASVEYIELVLSTTGIRHYFKQLYSTIGFDTKAEFIKNSDLPAVPAVIVGDSHSDIMAAKNNMLPSIIVTYGYGYDPASTDATFVAESVDEIGSYINLLSIFTIMGDRIIEINKQVVGINGVDASGKTMFANHFSRYLTSIGRMNVVLHLDDFHNPLNIRRMGVNEIDAYYRHAFNYSQIIHEILEPLHETGMIDKDVQCLDLGTDKYDKIIHYRIDRSTLLIIEGVLLFRPPILEYLQYKVFLQVDFDVALQRAQGRDVARFGPELLLKYKEKYIPVQERYLNEYKPQFISDIVLDNNDYGKPALIFSMDRLPK